MAVAAAAALLGATPIGLDEVRAASRKATTAQLSQLDQEVAGARVTQARAALLPQLGLNLGGGYTAIGRQRFTQPIATVDENGNPIFVEEVIDLAPTQRARISLTAGVNQTLYDAAQWAQLSGAKARFDAATFQAREDQLTAELEGITRFYDLVRAQKVLDVIEDRVKNSAELAQRADALFEAGRRRKEDAIAAEINLQNDRTALVRQTAILTQTSASLAAWIQRPPTERLVAVEPPALGGALRPVPSLEEALQAAQQQRPQLQALEALTRAARDVIGSARAGYLPSATAGLFYIRETPQPSAFFDFERQHAVSARVDVRWDFFSGFRTNAQVEEARLMEQRARLQLEQARRDLVAELQTRLQALAVQQSVTQIAEHNLKLAADNLELAQIRFEEGAGSTLEIRDAQVKHTQAELGLIESRIDLQLARAGVERAIGAIGPGAAR